MKSRRAKEALNKVQFPRGLDLGQALRVVCWEMFNKNKFTAFIENIEMGKNLKLSYVDAKNIDKNYETN